MKVLPFSAAVLVSLAAGLAAGRWLWPAAASPAENTAPASTVRNAVNGTAVSLEEKDKALPPFDGTLDSLRAMARAAKSYNRAHRRLLAVLEPLGAVQIASLTAAWPWSPATPPEENAVLYALLAVWAEKDAEAALRWAENLTAHRQRDVRSTIFTTLGESDLPRALALVDSVKNPGERQNLKQQFATSLARTDPEAALRLLKENGKYRYRTGSIFFQWAQRDPAAAWAKASSLSGYERTNCQQSVLRAWALTDLATARALAESLPAGRQRRDAVATVLGSWAGESPAAAFAAAGALATATERDAAMNAVIGSWSGTDPAAALQAAQSLARRGQRDQQMQNILRSWAQSDPAAAAAVLETTQLSRNNRSNLLSQLASYWSQQDADACLTWARSLPNKDGRNLISSAISSVAATDPSAGLAAWKSLSGPQQRASLHGLVSSWAGQDLAAATAFATSQTNPRDRNSALQALTWHLTFAEPEQINALFAQLPVGPTRLTQMRQFMRNRLSGGEGEETVAWLRALSEEERSAILTGSDDDSFGGGGLQNVDPRAWAALLAETPGATSSEQWRYTAGQWAQEDPAAALLWANSLNDPARRRAALQSALQQWSYDKPGEAMQAAQGLPEGQERDAAMQSIIQNWSYQDHEALLAWAATATGEARENALITGGLAQAEYDPEAGAKVLAGYLHGEKTSAAANNAAAQIARGWFNQDTEKGTAWVASLPENGAREAAAAGIVSEWTSLDPVAASEWVQTLPAGGSRDAAVQSLVQGIRQSDPERALQWATSIGNAAQREEAVVRTLDQWRWQDKTAAAAAAATAPISPTARDALLQKIEKQ